MEAALRAIANPRRRAMLDLLWERERSAGEIAELSALSKPATSQHLAVLRDAGLVRCRAAGNQRFYRCDPVTLTEVRAALEAFWGDRLAAMRDALEGGPR
jgi:DNA-binding transcriptional ArsR family regulator